MGLFDYLFNKHQIQELRYTPKETEQEKKERVEHIKRLEHIMAFGVDPGPIHITEDSSPIIPR